MTLAIIQIKILPEAVDTNLEEIKNKLVETCDKISAILNKTEIQEIAFGLKALIATIGWPEKKDQEELENAIKEIPKVSSTEIIDYRRAIG